MCAHSELPTLPGCRRTLRTPVFRFCGRPPSLSSKQLGVGRGGVLEPMDGIFSLALVCVCCRRCSTRCFAEHHLWPLIVPLPALLGWGDEEGKLSRLMNWKLWHGQVSRGGFQPSRVSLGWSGSLPGFTELEVLIVPVAHGNCSGPRPNGLALIPERWPIRWGYGLIHADSFSREGCCWSTVETFAVSCRPAFTCSLSKV